MTASVAPNTSINKSSNLNDVEVVYIVGSSGVGKSFSGDYLEIVHGYTHIDGDGPVKQKKRCRHFNKISSDFYTCVNEYWPKNEDGPEHLWQPYMCELVRQTLAAATQDGHSNNKKIVLTHATYRDKLRRYVFQKLQENGIVKHNMKKIKLLIDPDIQRTTIYKRNKKLAKAGLPTLEDNMRAMGWDVQGLLPKKAFKKFYAKYLEVPFEAHDPNHQDAFTVETIYIDVSTRDAQHFARLDAAIGLKPGLCDDPSSMLKNTYESVCQEIRDVEHERDKVYALSSPIDPYTTTERHEPTPQPPKSKSKSKKKPTLADYYKKRDEKQKLEEMKRVEAMKRQTTSTNNNGNESLPSSVSTETVTTVATATRKELLHQRPQQPPQSKKPTLADYYKKRDEKQKLEEMKRVEAMKQQQPSK